MLNYPVVFSGFTPAQLPLCYWFTVTNPNTFTKDGSDLVTPWTSVVNSSVTATQSTTANKPKWFSNVLNGQPSIRFRWDGTNGSWLQAADDPAMNHNTFYAWALIRRQVDLGAFEIFLNKSLTTGNQREYNMSISSADRFSLGANSIATPADGTVGNTQTVLPATAVTTGVTYFVEMWTDGINLSGRYNNGTTATGALLADFNGTAPLIIGAGTAGASPAGIDAFEFGMTNVNIFSTPQRKQLVGWINGKYATSFT